MLKGKYIDMYSWMEIKIGLCNCTNLAWIVLQRRVDLLGYLSNKQSHTFFSKCFAATCRYDI